MNVTREQVVFCNLPSHLIHDKSFYVINYSSTTQFLRLESIPLLNSFPKKNSINDLENLNII